LNVNKNKVLVVDLVHYHVDDKVNNLEDGEIGTKVLREKVENVVNLEEGLESSLDCSIQNFDLVTIKGMSISDFVPSREFISFH
jgi:hypothetical protein